MSRRPLFDDEYAAVLARRQLRLASGAMVVIVVALAALAVVGAAGHSFTLMVLTAGAALLAVGALLLACVSQLASLTAFALRRKVS